MRAFTLIALSVFVAIFLTLLPLPHWAIWLRPKWMVLVTIYWGLMLPTRYGVGVAWLIGLLLDITQGTLLGEQAFALAFITYITIKCHAQIRLFVGGKRMLVVFILVLIYQIIMFLLQMLLQKMPLIWQFWLPAIASALIWPWVYLILKTCQRWLRVTDPVVRGFIYNRD